MSSVLRRGVRRPLAAAAVTLPLVFGAAQADSALAAGMSLNLVNAANGQSLGALSEGQNLDLARLGKQLDVQAVAADAATKSVKLCFDGSCRTENSAPYTLDNTSDSALWTPTEGAHTITATGYSATNATGTKLGDTTVKFTVGTPAPAPTLKLVNQVTGASLGALVDGQTIDLAKVGTTLDVIADPADAKTVSMKLTLDGTSRVEGSAPFTLDDNADSTAWKPTVGTHTLTVTGYSAAGATGTKRGESTITFTVVDTTPAPTAPAAPATTAPATTTPAPAPAPAPSGSVLWSHPLSALTPAFDSTPWNIYGGGSVGIVTDSVKGKVYRSFGVKNQSANGSQRAEQVPSRKFSNGETVWAGFDLWTNAGLPTSSTWASVMQFKTGGAQDGAPPVSVDVNAHGAAGLDIASARIGGTEAVHKLGGAPNGNWTRLVVGIHVNTDPNKAWVEVWRDGKQVLAREPWRTVNYPAYGNKVGGTMFPGGNGVGYFKFGVYRGPQGFDIEARYANIKFATTREAAM
jgi:hypothetical protein